ncbi:hypothetical protein AVEN_66729-1 [Araneus ventricosus]|uniref:Polyamine-modulated factor 1 n=1 Tax=Araneus ventricosus TaxID=182803 RepID=A0A4Y2JKK1_ARAVE|nr:hypothetical protein AVEN_66729-1 [Araneus ventricosus]
MSAAENFNQPSTSNDPKPSFGVPEGRLGNYYEHAVTQTLEKFLGSIKYSLFKEKFPEIFKECDQELRDLPKQLINQLKTTITTDIKNLSKDTDVFTSLKSLDDIITEQKDRAGEDTWRPSGNPENDIREHIYHQKQKQKRYLEFVLEALKAENNMLETTVEENHAEILKLKEEFDINNQEVQSNVAAINATDFPKLAENIHTMFEKH